MVIAAGLLAACGAGQSATSERSELPRAESDVGAAAAARERETKVRIQEAAATPSPEEAPEPAASSGSGVEAWRELPELTIGATVRSSVGPGQISAFDLGDPSLPSSCRGCDIPRRDVPASFHRLRLEAGEYTLILEQVEPDVGHCGFGVERSFRVPENHTKAGWRHALRRGLNRYEGCYRSPGHDRTIFSAREAGEYIIAIVESVDFRDYPSDAREGLCGEFTLTLRRGAHPCLSD